MDVNKIKVGDLLVHISDNKCYRLVLGFTLETFWLGNAVGGKLHKVKEDLVDFRYADAEEIAAYYEVLKSNKVEYIDSNGTIHPHQISKLENQNAIILNGTRYELISPAIESCDKCDLDKFCDKFKEALCDMFADGNKGLIFKKVEV